MIGISESVRRIYTPNVALSALSAFLLAGCSIVSTSGPSTGAISKAGARKTTDAQISVIDVDSAVTSEMAARTRPKPFSEIFGDGAPISTVIERGDTLDISIWEAPPATLFGAGPGDARLSSYGSTARGTSFPEQMVELDGRISIPFVGAIVAAGRTPSQVADQITARLAGKAHQPQALVRLIRNSNTTVTVVGDVANNTRIPLTPKGERLLDVLAGAGGTKQPIGKVSIQLTRGHQIASLPLETVIRDPRQNIRVQPNDVVTALYQPFSFTALGATGRNEEIPFEATGLTLSQALGRVQGLQDARANAKGVFIFRLVDSASLESKNAAGMKVTPDGKVPIIYRLDLRDPRGLFLAQSFPMRDKDVLYVSNAPLADLQKFVNVIYSAILPVATAVTVVP